MPKDEKQKRYVLADESKYNEVVVGGKTVSKGGESVALTEGQYERASAIDGVTLEEAEEE